MVFFSCNACGESLKKNQVEKHYQFKCRQCESLSCIDCNKVFWGDEYAQHTKCISEEEKYSGKNYVPKANANKGEVKQNQWLKQVQTAIEKTQTNPRLKSMLERIQDYPNIPRKRPKFENFLRNSLNYRDTNMITQVWDILMINSTQSQEKENGKENRQENAIKNGQENAVNKVESTAENSPMENGDISEEDAKEKKSKREKKEERRAKMNKEEKKDKNSVEENGTEKKKRKKHKRKRDSDEEGEDTEPSSKKSALQLSQTCQKEKEKEENCDGDDVQNDLEVVKAPRRKFNWEEVITAVLKAKGEISLKKLRKKVLAEYVAKRGEPKDHTKVLAKLTKKVQNNKKFKVHKERVKLKERH